MEGLQTEFEVAVRDEPDQSTLDLRPIPEQEDRQKRHDHDVHCHAQHVLHPAEQLAADLSAQLLFQIKVDRIPSQPNGESTQLLFEVEICPHT